MKKQRTKWVAYEKRSLNCGTNRTIMVGQFEVRFSLYKRVPDLEHTEPFFNAMFDNNPYYRQAWFQVGKKDVLLTVANRERAKRAQERREQELANRQP